MTCRDQSGDIQSYHALAKYSQMGEYSRLVLRPRTSTYVDPPRHLTISQSESLNIIAKIVVAFHWWMVTRCGVNWLLLLLDHGWLDRPFLFPPLAPLKDGLASYVD